MTDSKLRELERRWKETGSAEDEAAYLLECVRVGVSLNWASYQRLVAINPAAAGEYLQAAALDRNQLEIAAYCGHKPASAVLGPGAREGAAQELDNLDQLGTFVSGFAVWGKQAVVRAIAASARTVLTRPHPRADRLRETLRSVDAWLSCPCVAHATACRADDLFGSDFACLAVFHAGAAVRSPVGLEVPLSEGPLCASEALGSEARAVADAICQEVVPWALGFEIQPAL